MIDDQGSRGWVSVDVTPEVDCATLDKSRRGCTGAEPLTHLLSYLRRKRHLIRAAGAAPLHGTVDSGMWRHHAHGLNPSFTGKMMVKILFPSLLFLLLQSPPCLARSLGGRTGEEGSGTLEMFCMFNHKTIHHRRNQNSVTSFDILRGFLGQQWVCAKVEHNSKWGEWNREISRKPCRLQLGLQGGCHL